MDGWVIAITTPEQERADERVADSRTGENSDRRDRVPQCVLRVQTLLRTSLCAEQDGGPRFVRCFARTVWGGHPGCGHSRPFESLRSGNPSANSTNSSSRPRFVHSAYEPKPTCSELGDIALFFITPSNFDSNWCSDTHF